MIGLGPHELDLQSPHVQAFIETGLDELRQLMPVAPPDRLTKEELHGLVNAWSEGIGVPVTRVQVRRMRTKWASCSTQGTLTLGADLVRLPRELVECVICHDLLHLMIPDHGKGFQALMNCYMPEWREREQRLSTWVVANISDTDKDSGQE